MFFTTLKGGASVTDRMRLPRQMPSLADFSIPSGTSSRRGIWLQQCPPLTMLNLRGAADVQLIDAVRTVCGCELPVAANASSVGRDGEILKLGPNEWLLIADPATAWSETMSIAGATLTDVSHARVAVRVDGDKSRDMLAKGCAVDLHPRQFPAGACIQTSIAKIGVILHRQPNANGFTAYAARSFAGSFWHWLTAAAAEYGYDVTAAQRGSIPLRHT